MTVGLTLHQSRLLAYIEAHIAAHDIFPTYREMAAGLGKLSVSGVFEEMQALENRGFVERVSETPNIRRPWRIKQPRPSLTQDAYERAYQAGFEAGVRSVEAKLAPAGAGANGTNVNLRTK